MMGGPLLFRCYNPRWDRPDDLLKVIPTDDANGFGAVIPHDGDRYLSYACVINCLADRGSQIRFYPPLALDVVARDPNHVGLLSTTSATLA